MDVNAENQALIERMRALREKIMAQQTQKKTKVLEKKALSLGNGKGLDDKLLHQSKRSIGNGKGLDDLLLNQQENKDS